MSHNARRANGAAAKTPQPGLRFVSAERAPRGAASEPATSERSPQDSQQSAVPASLSQTRRYRMAVAAYPFDRLTNWSAYETKVEQWVADAAEAKAKLLVFPEYSALELGSVFGAGVESDIEAQCARIAEAAPVIDSLHRNLAARYDAYILAGSMPVRGADETFVNRARLFAPKGGAGWQDKLKPGVTESQLCGVSAATAAHILETSLGRMSVLIGSDAEQPNIAQRMSDAGVDVLLAPGQAETLAGHTRLRLSAAARAMEAQCVVAQATIVGDAPWSPIMAQNHGAAAVFCPPAPGFPTDGVLAQGGQDRAGWVFADIDLDQMAELRERENHAEAPAKETEPHNLQHVAVV